MIYSMTAFARAQGGGQWGNAVCELRSINHRYLEISIKLPENLQTLESVMRERIRHHLKRGKIECYVRYQPSEITDAGMIINTHLAKKLCEANEAITGLLNQAAAVNPMDILRWPGILQIAETNLETIQDHFLEVLEKALIELMDARKREGTTLKNLFLERLEKMKEELVKVRQHMPTLLQTQRERLVTRFKEANVALDTNRFEQELVFFAQKIDFSEEVDRIDSHISEVRHVLKHGGLVGRRLDFLMQELHREANTLGAKSVDVETTRVSVELKVLIEQIREQVQNVE